MPSLRDLFADPDLVDPEAAEGEDKPIDIDKILDSVTDVLNDRSEQPDEPKPVDDPDPVTTEEPPVIPAGEPEVVGGEEPEPEDVAVAPAVTPAAPPSDPFLELPADRRAALLALDQALMDDESKRAAVFGILSGQPKTEAAKPTLPDHIDPDSFEAQLWRDQQEQREVLSKLASANRDQQEAFEKQRANTAAMTAGNQFAHRYDGKLTQDDVLAIARQAGQSGLAGALMQGPVGQRDAVAAFDQALEATLWANQAWRDKVTGEETPVVPPGETAESKDRKRKLTSVSSAASPVSGPSPKRSPAETGADGRLTEKSRQDLVKELANGMARQSEGAF